MPSVRPAVWRILTTSLILIIPGLLICDILALFFGRAHSNGSIRRGHKNDASDAVTMRTGLGINLKDVKVFNRAREKG